MRMSQRQSLIAWQRLLVYISKLGEGELFLHTEWLRRLALSVSRFRTGGCQLTTQYALCCRCDRVDQAIDVRVPSYNSDLKREVALLTQDRLRR